jgi:predicted aspartyl protease
LKDGKNKDPRLFVSVEINGKKIKALVDCGAGGNFIAESVFQKLRLPFEYCEPIRLMHAGGGDLDKVTKKTKRIEIKINGFKSSAAKFLVAQNLAYDLILGTTWLKDVNPQINWKTNEISVSAVTDEGFSAKFEEQVKLKYPMLVSETEQNSLPPHRDFDCEIPLIEEPKQTTQTARRLSPDEQKTLDLYLNEQIRLGRIVPSKSSIAAQILFVPKKDKTTRICVDFRNLNEITQRITFPMPRVDELLERTGNA